MTDETGRMMDPLMTIAEVAQFLHLSPVSLYRAAQSGSIPGYKILGSWRFNRVEIQNWLERRRPRRLSQDERNLRRIRKRRVK